MVRKTTLSKSAAKKADARKHAAPKAGARPSSPSVKAATRKGLPARIRTEKVLKAASAKAGQAKKAPVKKAPAVVKAPVASKMPVAMKPPVAKVMAKAPAATKIVAPQMGAATKPLMPKAEALRAAMVPGRPAAVPIGVRRMPAAMPKHPGQAITAAAAAAPKAAVVDKAALARQQAAAANKRPVHQRHGFKTNEWIVYPAHGVGRIVGIEEQEIAGISLELFVITFEKDKMTLRVPTGKSTSVGMRKLAEEGVVKRAMETLKGRARVKRTMWSRRAQEYEAKINSGDLIAIAEVVRDLYRSESQPEQSYSERQLYEAALDRMAREIAAVDKLDERGAVQRITEVLSKSAKGRRLAAEEAEIKAA
jgi:CarD family transcriptional regulator